MQQSKAIKILLNCSRDDSFQYNKDLKGHSKQFYKSQHFLLTLCLSICKGLRFGSKSSRCGSKFTGDCRRPLLQSDHSGLINPQNAGPGKYTEREREKCTHVRFNLD